MQQFFYSLLVADFWQSLCSTLQAEGQFDAMTENLVIRAMRRPELDVLVGWAAREGCPLRAL
ncbi:MAG: hypothetical protein GY694_02060 [Gammaproteobacteria bacterium]|nr:hypothetical protein [Gammaproteobacteria bacterium]